MPHNTDEYPGYHVTPIARGTFGEPSKITEEMEEFLDALSQGNPIMALVELSDLLGAVEGYLVRYFPNTSLNDLIVMKDATKRAFVNGHRTTRY